MNPTQGKHIPAAFTNAKTYFENEGIDFPYVAEKDTEKFLTISQDIFGTYPQASSVYDNLNGFVTEALSTPRDYVLFGIDGHGVNSKAMHYYAVKDHIAIFVKIKMGIIDNKGNLEDDEAIRENINSVFYGISKIFEKMQKAESQNLIPDGERLLIIESDFGDSGWEWISGNPGKIDEAAWNKKEGALLAALRAIPVNKT